MIPGYLERLAHSHVWRELRQVRKATTCEMCGRGPRPKEQGWWVYRGPSVGTYHVCPDCWPLLRGKRGTDQ